MTKYIQLTDQKGIPITINISAVTMIRPVGLMTGVFEQQQNPGVRPACDVWISGIPNHWTVRETYNEVKSLLGIDL